MKVLPSRETVLSGRFVRYKDCKSYYSKYTMAGQHEENWEGRGALFRA
jgi:hypothetical protein